VEKGSFGTSSAQPRSTGGRQGANRNKGPSEFSLRERRPWHRTPAWSRISMMCLLIELVTVIVSFLALPNCLAQLAWIEGVLDGWLAGTAKLKHGIVARCGERIVFKKVLFVRSDGEFEPASMRGSCRRPGERNITRAAVASFPSTRRASPRHLHRFTIARGASLRGARASCFRCYERVNCVRGSGKVLDCRYNCFSSCCKLPS
jgi:hypothetical protein